MDFQALQARWRASAVPWLAFAVCSVVWITMWVGSRGKLSTTLGDTDDALRLVLVRALAHGDSGWWDQHVMRLQPPVGVDMHWSRLVDGGIAIVMRFFELFASPAQAELLTRFVWPMLWVIPAVWGALAVARRMGGTMALLPAAGFLALNPMLYTQFWPGRIDHHNVQIASVMVALAGAVRGGRAGGSLAAVATAAGLAVGLEALPFLAMIGGAIAFAFLLKPNDGTPTARGYGLVLLILSTALYAVQTPPTRWGVSVCDMMGLNLWAALAIAGAGLVVCVQTTATKALTRRFAAMALVGAAAAAVYVALDPTCLKGPLGAVDPRIKPIWLNQVAEMRGLFEKAWTRRTPFLASSYFLCSLGAIAWLIVGWRKAGRTQAWALTGALFLAGFLLALDAERMVNYAHFCAVPLIGAALSGLLDRPGRSRIMLIALTGVLSQQALVPLLNYIPGWKKPQPAVTKAGVRKTDACIQGEAFRVLKGLPPGLVLGEVDLGPRILAQTPHSTLSAPYHRMTYGILSAHEALSAPPGKDEQMAHRLGVTYVVTCPDRHRQLNHHLGPTSLQVRLDQGRPPAWLQPLSRPEDPLQVYRVRPMAR